MNLSQITTPADLVTANNEQLSPYEMAVQSLEDVGFEDTVKIARWLVSNLHDFHVKMAQEKIEEGANNIAAWVADAEKLSFALTLIDQVEID